MFLKYPDYEWLYNESFNTPFSACVGARGSGKTYNAVASRIIRLITDPVGNNPYCTFATAQAPLGEKLVEEVIMELSGTLSGWSSPGFISINHRPFKAVFNCGAGGKRYIEVTTFFSYIRGRHPRYAIIDEVADIPKGVFSRQIVPWNTKNTLCIGTIKGKNEFWEMLQKGQDPQNSEWSSLIRKWDEIVRPGYREQALTAQKVISTRDFDQEYNCDPNANVLEDAVYNELFIRLVRDKGHIHEEFDYDPAFPLYVCCDIGLSDLFACWFFQKKGNTIVFVDYKEFSGKYPPEIGAILKNYQYPISALILPPDANAHRIDSVMSVSEQFMKLGFNVFTAVGNNSSDRFVEDGCRQVASAFTRMRFSPNCFKGIERLCNYTYKTNKQNGERIGFVHDVNSHGSDAMRYVIISENVWGSTGIGNIKSIRVKGF